MRSGAGDAGGREFSRAVVRKPGPDLGLGLTTAGLGAPEFGLILRQHEAYIGTLISLGLEVIVLEAEPGFPDGYFVEDTAVLTGRTAVIARPGAASRRGEERTIEPVLARFRPTVRIEPPGTLDGGDVLQAGGRFFIGLSERTNEDGARQLGQVLDEEGSLWTTVPVGGGLHLKSSVNTAGGIDLLVTESFATHHAFAGFRRTVLDAGDEYAANVLSINGRLIVPAGFPRARRKLEKLGLPILELDMSEARKMDGGLTCLSLRFRGD
jgi:dimethylargininase